MYFLLFLIAAASCWEDIIFEDQKAKNSYFRTTTTSPAPNATSKPLSKARQWELGSCPMDVDLHYNNSKSAEENLKNYDLVQATVICDSLLYKRDKVDSFSVCPLEYFDVDFEPLFAFDKRKNEHPYATINISALVHVPVGSVTFQYECVYGPVDQEDSYCHDHMALVESNSRRLMPCRSLQFKGEERPLVPFRFSYGCFRMFTQSQYRVNITIRPQKCRMSYFVTSPLASSMFPVEHEYVLENKHIEHSSASWVPILAVNTDYAHGVVVKIGVPFGYPYRNIDIVFATKDEESPRTQHIMTGEELSFGNNEFGAVWTNVRAGNYVAYAYVRRHDCQLICDTTVHNDCKICHHVSLNFTVNENKGGFVWLKIRSINDNSNIILVVIIASFMIIMLVAVACSFLISKRRQGAQPAQDVQLTDFPSVLIVYAEDCDEHVEVVLSLARFLERHLNARVSLDVQELTKPDSHPYNWILERLSSCQIIFVVVSPTSPFLLRNTHSLITTRPFEDMYDFTVNSLIRTAISEPHHFAIIRLPYSPVAPPVLGALTCEKLDLPAQLPRLCNFMHENLPDNALVQNLDTTEFENSIVAMQNFIQNNPNWMDSRLKVKVKAPPLPIFDLNEVPVAAPARRLNQEEMAARMRELGLLDLEDEADDEETTEASHAALIEVSYSDSTSVSSSNM